MKSCAILGASGHGKVVAEIAELNGYSVIHFFDDRWPEITQIEHWAVYGDSNTFLDKLSEYDNVVVAIGNNAIRLKKHKLLMENGAKSIPLIHPKSVVSNYNQIGAGTVVMAGAVINPFCAIGEACIINTSAIIDHDCILGDGVHISPGAHLAGSVVVGDSSWIGIGASIKQLVNIGLNTTVAAGAAVIRDIPAQQIVMGVPAKNSPRS